MSGIGKDLSTQPAEAGLSVENLLSGHTAKAQHSSRGWPFPFVDTLTTIPQSINKGFVKGSLLSRVAGASQQIDVLAYMVELQQQLGSVQDLDLVPEASGLSRAGRRAIIDGLSPETLNGAYCDNQKSTQTLLRVDLNPELGQGLKFSAKVGSPAGLDLEW